LSIPDFARGHRQQVNLRASGGIPISIDDASGVTDVALTVLYDPALLNVSGGAAASGLPLDWQVDVDAGTPGSAVITAHGSALAAGPLDLVVLAADVPAEASYGDSRVLLLSGALLNGGALAVQGDEALFSATYFGDATGNGTYSGLDAAYIARIAVNLENGLSAFPRTDPRVIADVTGNGVLSGLDASYVARKSVGLPVASIPDLPGGSSPGTQPAPQALHIQRPAADSQAVASNAQVLADQQLTPVVEAAISRIESVASPESAAELSHVTVEIVDLPAGLLAQYTGQQTIQIDIDAAGYGWFVDTSPWDNEEFAASSGAPELTALPGTSAVDRADLLTTVLHELGHVLGLGHEDRGLMEEQLPLGARRLGDHDLLLLDDAAAADPHSLAPQLHAALVDECFASSEIF
jgi:hypothetical protein